MNYIYHNVIFSKMLRVLQCHYVRRYLFTLNKAQCHLRVLTIEKYLPEIIAYGVRLCVNSPKPVEAESLSPHVCKWLLETGYFVKCNYERTFVKYMENGNLALLKLFCKSHKNGTDILVDIISKFRYNYPKCTLSIIRWIKEIDIGCKWRRQTDYICANMYAANGYLSMLMDEYKGKIVYIDTFVVAFQANQLHVAEWILDGYKSSGERELYILADRVKLIACKSLSRFKWWLDVFHTDINRLTLDTDIILYGRLSVLKWACANVGVVPGVKTLIKCVRYTGNDEHKLRMFKWMLRMYNFTSADLLQTVMECKKGTLIWKFLEENLMLKENE